MIISYRFNGEFFDYNIEYSKFLKGILTVFSNIYEIDFAKVKELYDQDWLDADKIYEIFREDIDDHFKNKAYEEYIDLRYA